MSIVITDNSKKIIDRVPFIYVCAIGFKERTYSNKKLFMIATIEIYYKIGFFFPQ